MTILYTFTPPTDAWTGNRVDLNAGHEAHGSAALTDTYDYHSERLVVTVNPDACAGQAFLAFQWFQIPNPVGGIVFRIRFNFSIDAYPDVHTTLLEWCWADAIISNPGDWWQRMILALHPDGSIGGYWYNQYSAAGVVQLGVTYVCEFCVTLNIATLVATQETYIDGSLVVSGDVDWSPSEDTFPPPYVQLKAGITLTGSALHNFTLHMSDLVWTIEDGVNLGYVYLHGVTEV